MTKNLRIHEPDGSVRTILLEGAPLSLGRSHENDLKFPDDPSLSRSHLTLIPEGADWIVEDRGSKNGTLVNGERLKGRMTLRPGTVIEAGQIRLVFDPASMVSEPVDFYPEAEAEIPMGTVVTNLQGLLSGARTAPVPRGAPPESSPFRHPAFLALLRAGNELSGHRPLPELFRLILDLSIEAVGAERGVLMTLEDGKLTTQANHGEGFRISSAVRDRVLERRASLLVTDVPSDKDWAGQQSIVSQQVQTILAVPLQTEDRVTGMIYLDSRSFVRPFNPDDLNLLTVLANVAATRVEQERLRIFEETERRNQRDMEQAAEIQSLFLPRMAPRYPGFDVAGFNAACRTVGGDYYDFVSTPDDRLVVVLGDVSGKGLPAALLMTSLQGMVHAMARQTEDLGRLMSGLDQFVAARCPTNRFISLFYAILDPASGEIVYCNAGHNPPLLVRSGGAVERLNACGTVLGILPEIGYTERRVTMNPGDALIAFSDGVTETSSPGGEEFGEDRLEAYLQARQSRSAAELVNDVERAVAAWSEGAPPADDVTLVVVRRTEPGSNPA